MPSLVRTRTAIPAGRSDGVATDHDETLEQAERRVNFTPLLAVLGRVVGAEFYSQPGTAGPTSKPGRRARPMRSLIA